jgi:hypothetical protein
MDKAVPGKLEINVKSPAEAVPMGINAVVPSNAREPVESAIMAVAPAPIPTTGTVAAAVSPVEPREPKTESEAVALAVPDIFPMDVGPGISRFKLVMPEARSRIGISSTRSPTMVPIAVSGTEMMRMAGTRTNRETAKRTVTPMSPINTPQRGIFSTMVKSIQNSMNGIRTGIVNSVALNSITRGARTPRYSKFRK